MLNLPQKAPWKTIFNVDEKIMPSWKLVSLRKLKLSQR